MTWLDATVNVTELCQTADTLAIMLAKLGLPVEDLNISDLTQNTDSQSTGSYVGSVSLTPVSTLTELLEIGSDLFSSFSIDGRRQISISYSQTCAERKSD